MPLQKVANTDISTTGSFSFPVISGNTVIQATDNTNAALRITQLGTGNALVVEDSANPDSTPFVIDNQGRGIIGYTSSQTFGGLTAISLQINGLTQGTSSQSLANWGNVPTPSSIVFSKSRSGTVSTQTIVSDGDDIGLIQFEASDGTAFIPAARIVAEVDGTPGTNDMPGRLLFSTTGDGASTPTERMRITSAGNVGIGQVAPSNILHLYEASAPQIRVQDANGSFYIGRDSSSNALLNMNQSYAMIFNTAATERMRINSSGLVGIGETNPTHRLHVAGNSGAEVKVTRGTNDCVISLANNIGAPVYIGPTVASPLILQTNNTEYMRIDTSGNVGIGVTPTSKLHISGSGSTCRIRIDNTVSGRPAAIAYDDSQNLTISNFSDSGYIGFVNGTGSGTERMRITSTGRMLVGTTTENTSGGVLQVSNGITFPATQSASSDANTLDDYEEGTWTPVITNGTTGVTSYYWQTGLYRKIGNLVWIEVQISVNVVGISSGNIKITGLPFPVAQKSGLSTQSKTIIYGVKYAGSPSGAISMIIESSNPSEMIPFLTSDISSQLSYTSLTSGGQWHFQGSYVTTS